MLGSNLGGWPKVSRVISGSAATTETVRETVDTTRFTTLYRLLMLCMMHSCNP